MGGDHPHVYLIECDFIAIRVLRDMSLVLIGYVAAEGKFFEFIDKYIV